MRLGGIFGIFENEKENIELFEENILSPEL
jgi:hypothetical protein